MYDSSGSILQLPLKTTALSNVNLLIVTDNQKSLQAISTSLNSGNVEFTYDLYKVDSSLENLESPKYSAIIYDLSPLTDCKNIQPSIKKIRWIRHSYTGIPLILITDVLGDEEAVRLVQSGVNGYLLRNNLGHLPDTLQKTLFDFASKQAIATQQEELIRKQSEKIEQLEREKQSWLNGEKTKQDRISHLNHELRSPISSIVGFARMLKEQYYGPLNPKQLQYVSGILSSAEHLLALVKNYLDIVKIDANKQKLDLEKLAVEEICQAVIFIVVEKAKAKSLELVLDLDGSIDFCVADSLRLKQILINLLSNAIKFTDRGTITLEVKLKQNLIHFSVIDTGMGISPENITKLFKPFPQITSHQDSTGLGLALSRKLAQLHGGDITVTSELDKGSCFTLTIPQYQ